MEKRLKFKCWNRECQRDYSLFLELEGRPKLTVQCPFCEKDGIVDLDPYRKNVDEVFRTDSSDKKSIGTTFDFPEVIPTTQPEQ